MCNKMMPFAPTSLIPLQNTKPKIGFSIDSIVGNGLTKNCFSRSQESLERPLSPYSDCSYSIDTGTHVHRQMPTSPSSIENRDTIMHLPLGSEYLRNRKRHTSRSPINLDKHSRSDSPTVNLHTSDIVAMREELNVDSISPEQRGLSPVDSRLSRSPSPTSHKGPILVPGIPAGLTRPFPMGQNISDMKSLPPYFNSPEMVAANSNTNFIAAQFQMAAAIAHGHAGGQQMPPGGFGQHPAHFQNSTISRDGYPLYPWLLSRHGRIFPHRFPGNFLLQPFRKPKRVRTAFSPTQLLKLEHAFESNHYVVGAERKTLAQALNLTETQVKVWFQNRRTKHKRMQQEDGKDDLGNKKNSSSPCNSKGQISCDEDELIDMDDCSSDEESNSMH